MSWLKKMAINAFWMSLVVCLFYVGRCLYVYTTLCTGQDMLVELLLTAAIYIAALILGIQKGVFCQILGHRHESRDDYPTFDYFTVKFCCRCGDVKIKEKSYSKIK